MKKYFTRLKYSSVIGFTIGIFCLISIIVPILQMLCVMLSANAASFIEEHSSLGCENSYVATSLILKIILLGYISYFSYWVYHQKESKQGKEAWIFLGSYIIGNGIFAIDMIGAEDCCHGDGQVILEVFETGAAACSIPVLLGLWFETLKRIETGGWLKR